MLENVAAIIDANLNRASEGLRVVEDYLRFVRSEETLTNELATLRKRINSIESMASNLAQVMSRDSEADVRAKETPATREDLFHLLTANFKRVSEALRVLEEYSGNVAYNHLRYDVYTLEKKVMIFVAKPTIKSGVYLISHEVDVLKQGLAWGVSLIQLRDKDGDKTAVLERAKILAPLAKSAGIPFLVNDYVDIALLVDADGVHTGQDDISVAEQRQLMGPSKLIGRTTHTLEQGLQAQAEGADYVSVGPIWETPSKPNRDGIGFSYLEAAKTQLDIPYVAIGGIHLANCDEVLAYHPPLIGLIRDYENIPKIQTSF